LLGLMQRTKNGLAWAIEPADGKNTFHLFEIRTSWTIMLVIVRKYPLLKNIIRSSTAFTASFSIQDWPPVNLKGMSHKFFKICSRF
jgi:hypothetical protein